MDMDIEQIKQLATDVNNVALTSFQSGKEHTKRPLLAKIDCLKNLLQEALDLYFKFSNKDDFEKWVLKVRQALE